MGGSRDQNHTNSNVISRRFLGWLRRHVGGSPLVGGVWNRGLYRARTRVRGTWGDSWFARSGRAWRGGTNCRSNGRTHINAMRTGGCRPVCDHRRLAFRNRRPAGGCQQCSCDDRARRIIFSVSASAIRSDWRRPVDQVHSLPSRHGLFVERRTDHRPWTVAEVSWPSKRRFSLAGADLTGPLEMAGRYRWNRHDLSDAFGSKDHSEIARDDPWPFWRRAGLFRSLPCFAGTFGFAQQPSGGRTSPSRCFVIRRRHEPSERARDIEFFNSQADRRAGIDA